MASQLQSMAMDLAASLWIKPCSYDELYNRKVLKSIDEYNFRTIVNIAKSKGYIWQKGEQLKCYRKTVEKVLNPEGYELELPMDIRTEFEKEFDKYNGKK
jgi:hypothetical protein